MIEAPKTNIKEKSMLEIASTAKVNFKFYAPPWLFDGSCSMLFAPAGHGKSHWAFHLALTIAEGGTWLGQQCTQGKVLYIDGEMGESQWLKRFPGNKFLSDTQDYLKIICPQHFPSGLMYSLSDKRHQEFWFDKCSAYDVIFIDNYLSTCFPTEGRETDVILWQSVQRLIQRLKDAGKAIVLIHHTNKGGLDQNGTGQRDNYMDTIFRLRQWPRQYLNNGLTWEIKIPKDRNEFFKGKLETLIDVVFTPDGISANERNIWEERKSIASELFRMGCTKTNIAKELGVDENRVSEMVFTFSKNKVERSEEDLI